MNSKPGARNFRFYLYNHRNRGFLEVKDGMVCGRSDGDVNFEYDRSLSRRHCVFRVEGNEIYIEDIGSTNQTRVNSTPIQSNRRRRLRLLDVIEMGGQRLVLTSQNRFPPGAEQDEHNLSPYLAKRKPDGSLTRFVGVGSVTQETAVFVDRSQYRELQFKRVMRPMVRPVKNHARWFMLAGALALAVAAGVKFIPRFGSFSF